MKKINRLFTTTLIFVISFSLSSSAQVINPKEVLKEKTTGKINEKIDEGVDSTLSKVERGIKDIFKKKKGDKGKESGVKEEIEESEDSDASGGNKSGKAPQQFSSKGEYDFVPGDKILYFEDFSQDAIGDFPALWTSNGSGEVKSVSIAPGKWFHLNGEDAVYCYMRKISFPSNFIIEFDIIPDKEYSIDGIVFTIYNNDNENTEVADDDLYPGSSGVHVTLGSEEWETLGYKEDLDWLRAKASKNTVVTEKVNHVIIWVQNRRIRIYHAGAKVLDAPTNIYTGVIFNRIRFSGWDRNSHPYISNIKITTASPDTRSKLLTEGKIVSYGIYFDSGKDVVKPESYGSVKEIATVLKENPDVKIRIVGHTDSDGDDALNLDLSKRRAAAVKGFLEKEFGIAAERIQTDGMGEKEPVASNDTPENKAKNRRVEFIKL